MRFEWDANKAASNLLKHGVSFNEAIEVFYDPNALEECDGAHSGVDTRFLIIGRSSQRLVFVVFVETESGSMRIISARKPTKIERRTYEGRIN
jgi:uncharacterized DUF497 family protein